MARFLIVRIALIVVTLLAVSLAIFSLIEFAPGDAATVILGQAAAPLRTQRRCASEWASTSLRMSAI